jgi:hypothetical protein
MFSSHSLRIPRRIKCFVVFKTKKNSEEFHREERSCLRAASKWSQTYQYARTSLKGRRTPAVIGRAARIGRIKFYYYIHCFKWACAHLSASYVSEFGAVTQKIPIRPVRPMTAGVRLLLKSMFHMFEFLHIKLPGYLILSSVKSITIAWDMTPCNLEVQRRLFLISCLLFTRLILRPWRWRQYAPPTHRYNLPP